MSQVKELQNRMYYQFFSRHKKRGERFTIQYLPKLKLFRIAGLNLDITKNLQWCKDVIDRADKFVPHNWKEVIKHPNRVFYI